MKIVVEVLAGSKRWFPRATRQGKGSFQVENRMTMMMAELFTTIILLGTPTFLNPPFATPPPTNADMVHPSAPSSTCPAAIASL
jgi:hypothetical protein